jgi:hypothetical protein
MVRRLPVVRSQVTRWLISVPVWGERCVDIFCAVGLPALQRAVHHLVAEYAVDARLVIHTDQADRVRGATDLVMEFRPVPAGVRDFDSLAQAHREVMSLGFVGDVVVPFTADSLISEAALSYCAEVFENNSDIKLILCTVPRVRAEGRVPDTGDAQALMKWAWANRHPMTQECTWPGGLCSDLSRTFFERAGAVATRHCLPSPLAAKIDGRQLRFTPTTDANLMQCFDRSELHMVPDCRQLTWVELSPMDKDFQRTNRTIEQRLDDSLRISDSLQCWCLEHKVMLVGPPQDCGDDEYASKILSVSKR